VKDPQDHDIRSGDLITDLIPLDENAPDLAFREAAEPFPEARLRGYATYAGEYGTDTTCGCSRVDRLQKLVDALQVSVGD
jgi:hypothetical protein